MTQGATEQIAGTVPASPGRMLFAVLGGAIFLGRAREQPLTSQ